MLDDLITSQFEPRVVQAGYVLGLFGAEQMPRFAQAALERAFDGTALRSLAGLIEPTSSDHDALIRTAFAEVGLSDLEAHAAAMRMCVYLSGEIARGKMEPCAAAEVLEQDVYRAAGRPEELSTFARLAQECQDRPGERDRIAAEVVAEANRWLATAVSTGATR